jgi:hypothetical protein
MTQILFSTQNDVSNDWLFYIENEAKSLAQRDEFAITNYIDRELFNPEVKTFLASNEGQAFVNSVNEGEGLTLNLIEEMYSKSIIDWLRPRFRKLKVKIRQIFCNVVAGIGEIDVKSIISAVLLALIPAFATGLPAAVLPIIIGLIAYLIKYGIEKTCPA